MTLKFYTLLFMLALQFTAIGQDKHFSQFFAAPISVNPALTGQFSGQFRVTGIYRSQWANFLDAPFNTLATSFEIRIPVNAIASTQDAIGAGVSLYTDRAAGSLFINNHMSLAAAYHKSLDVQNSQFITVGFNFGIIQRSLTYNSLTFQDQYDGLKSYVGATGESLPRNNITVGDYAFGVSYSLKPEDRYGFFGGISLHHFHQPNIAFAEEGIETQLYTKLHAQLGGQIKLSPLVDILPRFLGSIQGPHLEGQAGANFKIYMSDFSNVALFTGTWARLVGDVETGIAFDAVTLMVGLQYENFNFGVSYDSHILDFGIGAPYRNALEFSIAYRSEPDRGAIICPEF